MKWAQEQEKVEKIDRKISWFAFFSMMIEWCTCLRVRTKSHIFMKILQSSLFRWYYFGLHTSNRSKFVARVCAAKIGTRKDISFWRECYRKINWKTYKRNICAYVRTYHVKARLPCGKIHLNAGSERNSKMTELPRNREEYYSVCRAYHHWHNGINHVFALTY